MEGRRQTGRGNPVQKDRRETARTERRNPVQIDGRNPVPADGQKPRRTEEWKPVPADSGKPARVGGRKPVPTDGRGLALQTLTDIRRNGAWADAALRFPLDRLSAADAALASRLVYGVLQNRLLLDFYLNHFCTQRVDHLQHPLPDILRLGAYQILYLDRIPDRAAVGEAVEQAKRSPQPKAAGLVNAVLRNLSRNKADLPPASDLSTRYSHPQWLVERLSELLGPVEAEAFLAADNAPAPMTVQVNPLRAAPPSPTTDATAETAGVTMEAAAAALAAELAAAGVTARPHGWVPGCLELEDAGNLTALAAFRDGKFFVQDPAARLVTLAAGIRPGQRVLDVCAAPGGKSFNAAIALLGETTPASPDAGDGPQENTDTVPRTQTEQNASSRRLISTANQTYPPDGKVLSCDLHANKLARIRDGADRLGLSGLIETVQADGRVRRSDWEAAFDTVLADVPCSGLGVIRKKPDIRYKAPAAFAALPELQGAILDNAAAYVKPGGVLVYSTCTILPEENQCVTDAFLKRHPEFVKKPFTLPSGFPGDRETNGCLTLWPHRHGADGFYLCVMFRLSILP